jgi:uncharacterized protein YndB with AHSA1/START domain
MFMTVTLTLVALIAALLVYASTRPDTFTLQRSAAIQAPPEKVFALIDDYRAWDAWSPWEHKDPALKRNYGAVTSGKGAIYAWEGNKDVGKGSMTTVESVPPSKIVLNLDFEKPFKAHNTVTFTLAPGAGGTRVTWKMEGPVPYFAKILHMLCNMDKMVGKDFEAGLAAMKTTAES